MNRALTRLLALAGSATIGLFATVLFANPAQAHHPIISGTAVCQANGTYLITWKVGNGNWGVQRIEKIDQLSTDPGTAITGFGAGTMIPAGQHVTGTQTVPGSTPVAKLTVWGKWYDKNDTNGTGPVLHTEPPWTGLATGIDGTCTAEPDPTATFVSKCDGTVNVHVTNPGSNPAAFKVTAGSFSQTATIAAGGQHDFTVPAGSGAIKVLRGTAEIAKSGGWARPHTCPKPTALGEATCDTFFAKLTNPQGNQPAPAKVSYGSQVKQVTVAAGTTEVVKFLPGSETTASIEFTGYPEKLTATYAKPANCPGLPQTGDKTSGYLAAGIGLVALGAIVFFLARRHRITLRRMAA